MTDHPGEQFPSEVDPEVEPGYEPRPEEDPEPDYDSEPGAQSSYRPSRHGVPHSDPLLSGFTMYGELPAEVEENTEQAFEASVAVVEVPDEPAVEELEEVLEIESPPVERDEDAPHPLVEETMARLDELREKPVGEHAEVYADLHERLQTALVEADAEDRA